MYAGEHEVTCSTKLNVRLLFLPRSDTQRVSSRSLSRDLRPISSYERGTRSFVPTLWVPAALKMAPKLPIVALPGPEVLIADRSTIVTLNWVEQVT